MTPMRTALEIVFLASALPFSTAVGAEPTCGPLPVGWQQARSQGHRYVNTLVLNDSHTPRPTWNGTPVTDVQVRKYLGVTAAMSPPPDFLLIVSPNADCRQVETFRRMASEIVKCGPGLCVEVDP